jgi:hypothetical protein
MEAERIILERDFSAICGELEKPKSEARNPKQYPMIQIQMTKNMAPRIPVLNIEAFVF